MMRPLLVAVTLIAFSGFVPIDPDEPTRFFINIDAPPYQPGMIVELPFSYASNIAENTLIEIRLDAGTTSGALVYARALAMATSFSATLTLYDWMLNGNSALVHFYASGSGFAIEQTLPLLPAATIELVIEGSAEIMAIGLTNYSRIDHLGATITYGETLDLIGFSSLLATPAYRHLDLSGLRLRMSQPDQQDIVITQLRLAIGDPTQEFALLRRSADNMQALLSLKLELAEENYKLEIFDSLYVEPMTLLMSNRSIKGFVPSAYLFFPKDRYSVLKTIDLEFTFMIEMLNTYQITYRPTFMSETALLGPCAESQFCVTTTDGGPNVGIWEEVHVAGG